MYKLIEETKLKGYNYLSGFGFDEDSVEELLRQGEQDLVGEMTKLEVILENETLDVNALNDRLHALKGLLFQIGNHEVAEKINEIRSEIESENIQDELKKLLFYI
jgi:hypothetical protein